jgi:DNA repair exonuclease SbcCD ATPase subunit
MAPDRRRITELEARVSQLKAEVAMWNRRSEVEKRLHLETPMDRYAEMQEAQAKAGDAYGQQLQLEQELEDERRRAEKAQQIAAEVEAQARATAEAQYRARLLAIVPSTFECCCTSEDEWRARGWRPTTCPKCGRRTPKPRHAERDG